MRYKVEGKATWLYWRDIPVNKLSIKQHGTDVFDTKDKAKKAIREIDAHLEGCGRIDGYKITKEK